jgi:serine/threonine protein phosphatase 1
MIILTDIHGNYKTMMALLDKIPQSEKDKGIVICGDLIDRGPGSRLVVQYAIDNNIPCVTGNHEDMMVDDYEETVSYIKRANQLPFSTSLWLMNGGYDALKSYVQYNYDNLDDRGLPQFEFMFDVFEKHALWMNNLPLYLEYDIPDADGRKLVISHSSISSVWKHKNNPDKADIFRQNVIWGRPATIHDVPEIYNVFGHTPCQHGPKVKVPFANIDTGAFYLREPGYGQLTALQWPEKIIYQQENVEDEKYE